MIDRSIGAEKSTSPRGGANKRGVAAQKGKRSGSSGGSPLAVVLDRDIAGSRVRVFQGPFIVHAVEEVPPEGPSERSGRRADPMRSGLSSEERRREAVIVRIASFRLPHRDTSDRVAVESSSRSGGCATSQVIVLRHARPNSRPRAPRSPARSDRAPTAGEPARLVDPPRSAGKRADSASSRVHPELGLSSTASSGVRLPVRPRDCDSTLPRSRRSEERLITWKPPESVRIARGPRGRVQDHAGGYSRPARNRCSVRQTRDIPHPPSNSTP